MLDQNTGNQLITDSHSFTYQSGSSGRTELQEGGYQTSTGSYSGPTEWKFTNAGAEGSYGPTQSQVDSNYSGTSLDGQVTINTQGIQEWTVPVSGSYKIEVLWEEVTGGTNAGLGAKIIGYFDLFSSDVCSNSSRSDGDNLVLTPVEEEVVLLLLKDTMPLLLPEEVAVETGLPMLLLLMHPSTLQVTMIQEQLPAMRAEQMVMVEVQLASGEELVVEVSLEWPRWIY